MPTAHWCLLAALMAPYFLSVAARSRAVRRDCVQGPRAYSDTLTGWRRRAHPAHLNAFEATPALLPGVLVAELGQAPRLHIDALALAFIACRALHATCYIMDRPVLHSHAWRAGTLCIIALFVLAALDARVTP